MHLYLLMILPEMSLNRAETGVCVSAAVWEGIIKGLAMVKFWTKPP